MYFIFSFFPVWHSKKAKIPLLPWLCPWFSVYTVSKTVRRWSKQLVNLIHSYSWISMKAVHALKAESRQGIRLLNTGTQADWNSSALRLQPHWKTCVKEKPTDLERSKYFRTFEKFFRTFEKFFVRSKSFLERSKRFWNVRKILERSKSFLERSKRFWNVRKVFGTFEKLKIFFFTWQQYASVQHNL